MCPCFRLVGVICDAHCKGNGCRGGEHTDLCVGPGRLPMLEALYRHGIVTDPAVIVAVAEIERAAYAAASAL
ncbi:hypothetical protein Drose_05700 [Dactylosporangium roseum]|uniref:DUF433 domain-containing protein n=1 Tax=Dactylosporangium roseum TaxID=47989 RepID=A0ABY5Z6T9_9ACTN|nr:hypothetical protein [Dactylosporangium roseum]UWZ37764.1 hypothetical protein Drose_05700 [Dactylosporangium roseum]